MATNAPILDLYNLGKTDGRIFFGQYSGFQRYDNPKYTSATRLEETMRGSFWNPNEITLATDASLFHSLPEEVQDAYTQVLMFQTILDSTQNQGLEETLIKCVSNAEWQAAITTWAYFELIHSLSYSHIIRGIFQDSTPVFERNFNNTKLLDRVKNEAERYNEAAEMDLTVYSEENAKTILKLILTVFGLEAIKFYSSFLVTFLIQDEYGVIPGASRIVKLIAHDEQMHTVASEHLIKDLRLDDNFKPLLESEWFQQAAHEVFGQILEDEIAWGEHLIEVSNGKLPLSRRNLHSFLHYYVNMRLKNVGVRPISEMQEQTDLVKWFENFKDLNSDNIALQESDLAVYEIGQLTDDF